MENQELGLSKPMLRLLGVPKASMESITTKLTFRELPSGEFRTVKVNRPESAYPRWLKRRIKFRTRHGIGPFGQNPNPHQEGYKENG